MTEVELIEKMESCLEHGKECDEKQCRDVLIRDALAVIKMQKERLEEAGKLCAEKDHKNAELMRLCKVKCTQQQLADAVNDIIRSFDIDEDEVGCSQMEHMIRTLGDFMKLTGMVGHVAVSRNCKRIGIVLDV